MANFSIHLLSEKPEFAETCAAWSYGSWGCFLKEANISRSIEGYKKRAQSTDHIPLTWVGVINGKIIGMISLVECDHEDHKDLSPWLASMYVAQQYRNKGYASKLIQHLHKEAKNLGFDHLYLFTPDAMTLYEKNGWKVTGKVRDMSGIYDHEKLMEIEL